MKNWLSFDNVINFFKVEADLVNIEPLRVGAGSNIGDPGTLMDLPVIRINIDGLPKPYIPGSSLKGVLRSISTQVARAKGIRGVCDGVGTYSCGSKRSNYITPYNEYEGETFKILQRMIRDEPRENIIDFIDKNYCIVCKIFGGMSYLSHVYVQDSYIKGHFNIGVKTGIAINRRTGSTIRGGLYKVEFIQPGATFSFSIYGRNLPNYAIGLLIESLKKIDAGVFKIGGFKSRGFGRVQLKNLKFYYNGGGRALDDFDQDITIESRLYEGDEVISVFKQFTEVWNSYASKIAKS